MTIQAVLLSDFWDRYGRQEYEDTDFAQALARLPQIKRDGPWLAGGSVRRLLLNQPQDSDYDFFFKNEGQFDAFCKTMKAKGAIQVNENDFNITWTLPACDAKPVDEDVWVPAGPELKIQAIRIDFFDSLEAVIESFDFSICQTAFNGVSLVLGPWTLYDLASKRLVPGKIKYGTSSLRRMIKYARQGYTICGGGLASMLEQVVADPSIIQSDVVYID